MNCLLPTKREHISFSEMTDFFACPWRHKLKHIDKINIDIPTPFLLFGLAIHASCEKYLRTRILDIELALNKIKDFWADNRQKTQDELKCSDEKYVEFVDFFSQKAEQKALKEAESILKDIPKFLDDSFPDWEFIDAEHLLLENVENTENKFKGYIDGIIKYKVKNKVLYFILDWKTATRPWDKKKKQDPMIKNQLVFYKYFWLKKNPNIKFKDVRCGFVILNRGAKSGKHCNLFVVSVGDVTTSRAIKLIRNMFVSLNRKMIFKNKRSCQYCSFLNTKYCDAKFKFC